MRLIQRLFCWLLIGCAAVVPAMAEEAKIPFAAVEEMRFEGAEASYVVCPVFQVGEDAALSAKINEQIQNQALIMSYVQLLSQITEGSAGLRMDYEMTPRDGNAPVVSIVFSAQGKMLSGRPSQVYYPMVVDLRTGDHVTLEQLVRDPDAFAEFVEMYVEDHADGIISTHMENTELFPVPLDCFSLDEMGITFYYNAKQLSFLSGYAGSIMIPYHEMQEYLDLSENSVLSVMGYAERMIKSNMDTAKQITLTAEAGFLGELPVELGMPLEKAIQTFRSTIDAGFYPTGAYYEMEDARLRSALLLTGDSEETVTGIYSRNISLWGIRTGCSHREEWLQILGEPDFTMEMGESDASQYLLCAGTSDYYDYGEHQLQLHTDADGVLYAVILTQ